MNIVYIVHENHYNELSGAPLITKHYAEKAINKKNNVAIITPSENEINPYLNQKIIDGINFFNWPKSKDWNLIKPEMIEHKSFLKKIKIDFKPDIIHIIDLVNFRPDILEFCKSLKVPIIKHVINFEDLSFFDGELKYEHKNNKADKGEDLNTCLTCINNHYHNEKKVAGHIAKFLWFKFNLDIKNYSDKFEKRKLEVIDIGEKYFDHLIFPSKNFADFYFSHLNLKKNFDIIGFGVKKNLDNKNKIFNPNKKINFIFVGGGSERKGWKLIENSFDKILKKYENKINLRIYGFKKKTSKSKLAKYKAVEFYDSFDSSDLYNTLAWADFGLTTSYFETYCKILYEYLESGVIPISTNFFGSEIITNEINGIVINRSFKENLIKTVENILENPKVIERYSKNVKKTKILYEEEEFENIFNIYQKLKR